MQMVSAQLALACKRLPRDRMGQNGGVLAVAGSLDIARQLMRSMQACKQAYVHVNQVITPTSREYKRRLPARAEALICSAKELQQRSDQLGRHLQWLHQAFQHCKRTYMAYTCTVNKDACSPAMSGECGQNGIELPLQLLTGSCRPACEQRSVISFIAATTKCGQDLAVIL